MEGAAHFTAITLLKHTNADFLFFFNLLTALAERDEDESGRAVNRKQRAESINMRYLGQKGTRADSERSGAELLAAD